METPTSMIEAIEAAGGKRTGNGWNVVPGSGKHIFPRKNYLACMYLGQVMVRADNMEKLNGFLATNFKGELGATTPTKRKIASAPATEPTVKDTLTRVDRVGRVWTPSSEKQRKCAPTCGILNASELSRGECGKAMCIAERTWRLSHPDYDVDKELTRLGAKFRSLSESEYTQAVAEYKASFKAPAPAPATTTPVTVEKALEVLMNYLASQKKN